MKYIILTLALLATFTSTALAGGASRPIIIPKVNPIINNKTNITNKPKPQNTDIQALINKVVQYYGGADAIGKIKKIISNGEAGYYAYGKEFLKVEIEGIIDYENSRSYSKVSNGSQVIGVNIYKDGIFYVKDKGETEFRKASPQEQRLGAADLYSGAIGLYKLAHMPGTTFKSLGEQTWFREEDTLIKGQAIQVNQGIYEATFLIAKNGQILAEKTNNPILAEKSKIPELATIIAIYGKTEITDGIVFVKSVVGVTEKGNLFSVAQINSKAMNPKIDESIFNIDHLIK